MRTTQPEMIEATADRTLARRLVLDELFDLSLYRALHEIATGDVRTIIDQLIPIEARHLAFWQGFFDLHLDRLDMGRRLKLALMMLVCHVFGSAGIHLVLEAIEVYGVRKYLRVWRLYGDGPLGAAVREVLEDEFKHEDAVVIGNGGRRITPERVRNVFLGLNDGLVEILGAVSGFFAAFSTVGAVVVAAVTVAVAGALSMAAGAWLGASSEAEVGATERGRREFFGESTAAMGGGDRPWSAALVVGVSYFAGALVPVAPILVGSTTVWPSVLTGGVLIIAVSTIVAVLSGMEATRRVVTNLVVIAAAVAVSFTIGMLAKRIWGVSV